MIYQLIYVSAATRPHSREDLISLLEVSRRNNERDFLTGMLLYKDESFMQLLEGPREAVFATLGRIERDPSHTGIIRLIGRVKGCFPNGRWDFAMSCQKSSKRFRVTRNWARAVSSPE